MLRGDQTRSVDHQPPRLADGQRGRSSPRPGAHRARAPAGGRRGTRRVTHLHGAPKALISVVGCAPPDIDPVQGLDAELGGRAAAFAPLLLRSEAASSSQIENITASARAIFSAELGVRRSRNALLVTANTRALTSAIELADEITPAAIARMHEGQRPYRPGARPVDAALPGHHAERRRSRLGGAAGGRGRVSPCAHGVSHGRRVSRGRCLRRCVYPPLRALVDAGILTSGAEHRPGPFWRSDEVLAALERFADRAGRREAH